MEFTWQKEKGSNLGFKIILFIVSPFFSFLYSLGSLKTKSSYVVMFLFFLFFGLCFTVGTDRDEQSNDAVSYRQQFERYIRWDQAEYNAQVYEYVTFSGNEGNKDLFFTTLAFGVSRLTDNYHILFFFCAAIFGFFTLRCLRYLTLNEHFKTSLLCFLLFLLFTFNQIYNINGVRFWTAAWVGVYCIFKIVIDKNYRYYFLLALTPLIHVAFFVFVAVFLLCYFTRSRTRIWTVLFFLSFVFSSLAADILDGISDYLPPVLAHMVDSYSSESALAAREEYFGGVSWYGRILQFLQRAYPNLLLIVLLARVNKNKDSRNKDLFLFTLAFLTCVNFFMPIPSLGGRYILLSYPLLAYLWLSCFKAHAFNGWIYLMPLFLFRGFYVMFVNNYPRVVPAELLYMNPFSLLIKYAML